MSSLWTFLLTLAYCLPVLVLALPLLARRYVGERTLERHRRRPQPVARHAHAASDPPTRHRLERTRPFSGGRLLAASLAGRGPPSL